MRKHLSLLITVLIILTAAISVHAQERGIGIGVMVGDPTGLSFKSWNPNGTAVDAGLAWSVGRYDALHIHADYLWHDARLFGEIDRGALLGYVGAGGRLVLLEEEAVLGGRVPVGLNYLFGEAPLGVFLEIVPVVDLLPASDFDMSGAVGIRYYL